MGEGEEGEGEEEETPAVVEEESQEGLPEEEERFGEHSVLEGWVVEMGRAVVVDKAF